MRDPLAAPDPAFAELPPPDALRPAVTALHYHSEAARTVPYRRLPGPFAALVVSLDCPGRWRAAGARRWRTYPRVAIHGFATRWSASFAQPRSRTRRVMALIEPWAVEPLFGIAGAATIDRVVDIEADRPLWARELLRRIELGQDGPARLLHLGAVLADLARAPCSPSSELEHFLKMARESAGAVRIADAARARHR